MADRARAVRTAEARLDGVDWVRVGADLDARGVATTGVVLEADTCTALAALYDTDGPFRSRIVMARHGFGQGEYQYFAAPVPPLIAELRRALYAALVPTAHRWCAQMGESADFPATHEAYLARCHAAGQTRPTPLLLRYRAGDYNCLHQDIYGPLVFPLQAAFLLSRPGLDFTGGQLVVTEQRPRMQSRAEVIELVQGEAVIFAVNTRPVAGSRGVYRVKMRHGVSRVISGERHTLGIILHDAS